MNFIVQIWPFVRKHLWFVALFSITLAVGVFFLTRQLPKEYTSGMMIYTGLASGYNVASDGNQQKIDYNTVANAFDNIIATVKARETLEQVSLQLMAYHIFMTQPDVNFLAQPSYSKLKALVPDSILTKCKKGKTPSEIYEILISIKTKSETNWVVEVLNSSKILYGIPHISNNLTVTRKGNSDMLEITFTSSDPGLSKHFLQLLSTVFIAEYKKLKGGETEKVVAYFENEKNKSQNRLKDAEERMKLFGMENKIINYYEQTRFIADAQQDLVQDIQKEKINLASAVSAVDNLETKINHLSGMIKANNELSLLRKKLSDLSYTISHAEIESNSKVNVVDLKAKAEALKEEIKLKINDVYAHTYSKDNIPREDLVAQWLEKTIQVDQSKAKIDVLKGQLNEYDQVYRNFAPLGSTLKSLEREAEVAEKEYLEILHSLNVSKLMQQNIELTGNLKVIDPPFLPIQAKSSKRIPMVAGAFVCGILLSIGILVFFYFRNPTLDTIETFEAWFTPSKTFTFVDSQSTGRDGSQEIQLLIQSILLTSQTSENQKQIVLIPHSSACAHWILNFSQTFASMVPHSRIFLPKSLFSSHPNSADFQWYDPAKTPFTSTNWNESFNFESKHEQSFQLICMLPVSESILPLECVVNQPISIFLAHQTDVKSGFAKEQLNLLSNTNRSGSALFYVYLRKQVSWIGKKKKTTTPTVSS